MMTDRHECDFSVLQTTGLHSRCLALILVILYQFPLPYSNVDTQHTTQITLTTLVVLE